MTTVDKPADTRDMRMVHTVFRREFAALGALVRGVPSGDTERAHIVAEHVDILLAMLEAHHRAEDVHLWPKLLDRGVEVALMVEVMEEQRRGRSDPASAESPHPGATWPHPVVAVSGKGSGRVSIAGLVCVRPGQRSRLIYRTRTHRGVI